mgnify:FL=1
MDEAKTMTVDEALDALELDALDVVAQVRRLRANHTAALKAAREEGGAEMREACARIADACASERRRTLARWDEEGVPADDARRTWVYCKASEAERIRDAIRSLAALPLDGDGGEPVAQLAAVTAERDDARAALATARREGAEGMREVVKAEIHAAFHYNDPPDDGVERPIGPIRGQWEAHQTLRKLLLRVCVVLTDGGAA